MPHLNLCDVSTRQAKRIYEPEGQNKHSKKSISTLLKFDDFILVTMKNALENSLRANIGHHILTLIQNRFLVS